MTKLTKKCPKCGETMQWEWGNAGERYKCDNCGNTEVTLVRR